MQRPNIPATHCPPEMIGAGCAPTQTSPEGYQSQQQQFASQPEAAQAVVERDKAVATIIAEAALAGFSVYIVEGGFVACKWGWSRTFSDLASLKQWLGRCTGGAQ